MAATVAGGMAVTGADRPTAITGSGGRLGRALLEAADGTLAWRRPDVDLDDPACWPRLLDRDRPRLVIHAAAMTDVDACARQPELAMRRNGEAAAALASACRERKVGLVLISTNEIFSGERDDGLGYREEDEPSPPNPYGASKLAGEVGAQRAFGSSTGLWIVRTAWLYGPPGNDFPDKIVAAADRLRPGEPLPVVADEIGTPTFTRDLAAGIMDLVDRTSGGLYHLVADGRASRREWADRVLAARRPGRATRSISSSEFVRASSPPRWAVLSTARAAAAGITLRSWESALDGYLAAGPVS
jgi:dTDP-4-dehydrorhamnose reductase